MSFSDTKYCQSLLLPTDYQLKKTLDSTFVPSKSGTNLNEKDQIDLCCRSLYKCNAHKQNELNQTIAWNIRHCDCLHSYRICLKHLNTTISNKINFVYSLNTTKCYSNDHPIIKCIEFEKYPDTMSFKMINHDEHEKYFKRCLKYAVDQNRKKELQIFDMPLNEYKMLTTEGKQINS